MTGDGTNDAPALAQADVAVAMNTGTQAAKEAGNMVDLDSNPTKLIEIVEIGKQLLMTRGALTTFSIANDVAKYFAIIPAAFAAHLSRRLARSTSCGSHSPASAILSAVIFNALIIVALIPLALHGVRYRPVGRPRCCGDNLLVYGLGGLVVPFVGIKAIDHARLSRWDRVMGVGHEFGIAPRPGDSACCFVFDGCRRRVPTRSSSRAIDDVAVPVPGGGRRSSSAAAWSVGSRPVGAVVRLRPPYFWPSARRHRRPADTTDASGGSRPASSARPGLDADSAPGRVRCAAAGARRSPCRWIS